MVDQEFPEGWDVHQEGSPRLEGGDSTHVARISDQTYYGQVDAVEVGHGGPGTHRHKDSMDSVHIGRPGTQRKKALRFFTVMLTPGFC